MIDESNLHRLLDESYTVQQLIDELKTLPPDAPVLFTTNYGDYSRTDQAIPIDELRELTRAHISPSAYSNSGAEVNLSDDDVEPSEWRQDDPMASIVVLC